MTTSGFGVDPTKDTNGVVTSSTSSKDIRRIWGGLYSSGLVTGGTITTSPSTLQFTVSSGVAMIPSAVGENIATPFDTATVTAATAPTSGTRTDIIYVQQRFPSDGDSNVVVGIGSTLPPNSIAVAKYIIGTNITNSNSATKTGDVDYSIPYGASLGILHQWRDTFSGIHNQSNLRLGTAKIYLPTDRLLRFTITSLLYSSGANGFDNSKYCEWYSNPELDNQPLTSWRTPGLHQAWATYTWQGYWSASAGSHTVSYSRGRSVGPGSAATLYGPSGSGWDWPGTLFTVEDAGVVK